MEFKIIDTGYLNTSMTGTPEGVSDRAGYDGSSTVTPFTLQYVSSVKAGAKANISANPDLGTNETTEISKNSFENDVYTLKFLTKNTYNPSGFQYNFYYQLNRLKETNGIKLIYPTGTGNSYTVLNYLGEVNQNGAFSTTFIPTDTSYLPIEVLDVSFSDNGTKDYIEMSITVQLTK